MKCSVTFGSISSQRPAFFSLALLSRSMTHRRTEIWIRQGSVSVSPLIQEICIKIMYVSYQIFRHIVNNSCYDWEMNLMSSLLSF